MKKRSLLIMSCFLVWTMSSAQEIFDAQKVHEVRIKFKVEDWRTPLVVMKDKAEGDRMTVDVEVDGVLYEGAGVRFKGNSSYNAVLRTDDNKLPLNIKLNYTDKESKLPTKHKTLKLANGFRDPSFVREILAYDMARNYMPASRAVYAKVYANEDYLGLYTLVESVDNAFLDHYFGDHDGVLVKCDPNFAFERPAGCPEGDRSSLMYLGKDSTCYMPYYEMKTDHGWGALMKLIDVLHHDFASIEEHLDVDQALWMFAFDNYTVNLDSYIGAFCHNYYLYQDQDGVFHPIIWDMNLAFGGFRLPDDQTIYNNEQLKKTSMFLHYKENNEKRPMLTYLLRDDLYRKVYLAHIRTLLEEQGQDSLLYQHARELHDFARSEVAADPQKLYTDAVFEGNLKTTQKAGQESIIGVFELMDARHTYLTNHPTLQPTPPKISAAEATAQTEEVTIKASVKGASQVWLCYRYEHGRKFERIPMERGAGDEAVPGAERWETQVAHKEGLQYYILAENEQAASLLPKRASFEFFTLEN